MTRLSRVDRYEVVPVDLRRGGAAAARNDLDGFAGENAAGDVATAGGVGCGLHEMREPRVRARDCSGGRPDDEAHA